MKRGRWLGPTLTCLAIGAALLLASSASAKLLSSKVRNWPNTPLHHTLKSALKGNNVPSFDANIRGDVAIAGNTLETCPENVSGRRRHAHRRARTAAEPCLNANNNDRNMVYVNVDPSGGHFNSSSATLSIPTGARIAKAYLYWAADLSRGVQRDVNGPGDDAPAGNSPQTNPLYTTADLKIGGGSYSTIDATNPTRNGRWDYIKSWYSQPGNAEGWAYQVRADVTGEVNAGLQAPPAQGRANRSLKVTVADVQAGKGYNRYGGWNLVVVWTTATAPWRNVTLFDGFDFVQVKGGEQLVVGPLNFTGFETPAAGNVDAHATVWATEGDRAITGDYLSLGNLSNSCTDLPKQHDAAHPVANFFNSTISSGGNPVTGRDPGRDNQLGFDLTTLSVPEGTISNGATGASVCLGTVGDTYFFGGLAFTTLIRAPNLAISKTADRSSAAPDDVVTYTTTVTNPSQRDPSDPLFGTPVEAATNLQVADPIPSGLTGVELIDDGGGKCQYSDAARAVTCNVGVLAPDATFMFTFQARVSAVAQGDTEAPLVNSACYQGNAEDQPDVSYTGCDDASVIVPPRPPPPADLGVIKTVSNNIVKPGATVTWQLVGTNYGPATSTNFILADQLPAGVQFVRATASSDMTCTTPPVGQSGAVTCTAPTVPPATHPASPDAASQRELTIVATVPPSTPNGTLLFNVATVTGDQAEPTPDPHPNRDTTQTLVVVPPVPPKPPVPPPIPPYPPDPVFPPQPSGPPTPPVVPVHPPNIPAGAAGTRLRLIKAAPASARTGGRIRYTMRVRNLGEAAALNVRVCDRLPAGVSLVAGSGFHRSGRSVCAAVGTIKVLRGRTLHLSVRVTAARSGRLINRATATSRNAPTRRARATTRVLGPPPPPPPVTG
jgi:large repetitive protein